MAFHSFEELEVWKVSCRLAIRVYADLRTCKDYGLKDQMTRAAVSIASNIAEGAERTTGPDSSGSSTSQKAPLPNCAPRSTSQNASAN